VVARIAQLDSIEPRGFDQSLELAATLIHDGRRAGVPRWRERALTEVEWLEDQWPVYASWLFDLAGEAEDLEAMRRYAAKRPDRPHIQLRLALFEGDSTRADSLWASIYPEFGQRDLSCAVEYFSEVLLDGLGVRGVDRLIEVAFEGSGPRGCWDNAMNWARIRGRHTDWRTFRDAHYESSRYLDPVESAALRVRDVLFLGEAEDSSTGAAARWLRDVADGVVVAPSRPDDPSPVASNLALAKCWSTLWDLSHGSTEGAADVVAYLRHEAPLPYRWSVCAGLIEVFRAKRDGSDLRAPLLALDSIVRPAPMESPGSWGFRDGTHYVDNLFVSRELAGVGDTVGALTAARRIRDWEKRNFYFSHGLFADVLREEARLAAMLGDTAGAVDAYQHYFAVRDTRPNHPPWAAQWDSMRVEYGALTGVETP
jgi:hypothetical protein